ncbi:MAG: YqgE/AlgH family protein [Flavobacteriales bacterium]
MRTAVEGLRTAKEKTIMELLDFNKLNKLQPAKGHVLISEPFLDDDYFKRSVILLCEHNEEGTFGFVLNNYLDIKLTDLIEDLPDLKTRVSIGGPVNSDNLFYIHTLGDKIPGSIPIFGNVFMGGNWDVLRVALDSGTLKEEDVRFFVGYSGWSPGQLEEELSKSSWIVGKLEGSDVMDQHSDDLWKKVLKGMGKNFSLIADYPEDPTMN